MGRYYNGDIGGKFWFAVQSSNDADFFGVVGTHPEELIYYYDMDDLPEVKKGIANCIKELGENKGKLDKFFKDCDSYTKEQITEETGILSNNVNDVLKWYARLDLGIKIRDCLIKENSCSFTAEC